MEHPLFDVHLGHPSEPPVDWRKGPEPTEDEDEEEAPASPEFIDILGFDPDNVSDEE